MGQNVKENALPAAMSVVDEWYVLRLLTRLL